MNTGWFTTIRSSLLSVLLHIVVIALLIVNFSFNPTPTLDRSKNKVNIVEATQVDQKQLEKELEQLKKEEQDKKTAEQKRIKELEKQAEDAKKKAAQAEKKRLDEEKKLIAAKKKKELEQQKRELEKKRLEKIKKETEELERKKQIEKEKAEEAKKLIEERSRKEKEEAEKKRLAEEEKKLQQALAAEEAEAQNQADAILLANIAAEISDKVSNYFNKVGLPENLKCKLRVKLLPSGEVIDVSVADSSGNDIFDRRAVNAVQKASPLPVPGDIETFERLELRDITFTFTP